MFCSYGTNSEIFKIYIITSLILSFYFEIINSNYKVFSESFSKFFLVEINNRGK